MFNHIFPRIGIFANHKNDIIDLLHNLLNLLEKHSHDIYLEESTAVYYKIKSVKTLPAENISQFCDLAIVLGGDGSILNASRRLVNYDVAVIGINRGQLGFLADISPQELEIQLISILEGNFITEKRLLLSAQIQSQSTQQEKNLALNDVVLYSGNNSRLIEFDIYVNEDFVMTQRADGLITATPTGSTAYALSAGGPMIHPNLDVIELVPMFSHALTSRPLIIDANSRICLQLSKKTAYSPRLSCDGQIHAELSLDDSVHISKHTSQLTLLHPKSYQYYTVLRKKLGFNGNVTSTKY